MVVVQTDSILSEIDRGINALRKRQRFFTQTQPDNTCNWLISNHINRLEQEKAYIIDRRASEQRASLN